MTNEKRMKLVLASGEEFCGIGCGAPVSAVGEVIFNTSMVGYQEILSDPAYAGQIVVMTYPLMGQYGITDDDFEGRTFGPAAVVVRECCDTPSNFRYTKTFSEDLEDHGIPCVSGLDTRMITRIIRDGGCIKGAVVDESVSRDEALRMIAEAPQQKDIVSKVSCTKRWFSRTPHHRFDAVVIDCGLKRSIVTALNRRGCNVTVVPFDTPVEDILSFSPDGVMISNGPGSAADLPSLVKTVKELRGKLPVFGICLGHEVIALAYGASLYRLKHGHHGGRPVRYLETGKIITAEHNHDYTVDAASLEGTGLVPTYLDVADGTVAGMACAADSVRSVQFYPEGAPGPQESPFFDNFIKAMEE